MKQSILGTGILCGTDRQYYRNCIKKYIKEQSEESRKEDSEGASF